MKDCEQSKFSLVTHSHIYFLVSVSGAAFSKAGKAENPDVLGKVAKTGVVDTKAAKSGGKKKHNFCWVGCKLYTSFVANHVFSLW